jgi:hypothetical protein
MEKDLYKDFIMSKFVNYIEEEMIIPKINSIVDLERIDPYPYVSDNYWTRIKKSLNYIETLTRSTGHQDYLFAALALFANVLYIPTSILIDVWRYHLWQLKKEYSLDKDNIMDKALLLAEDFHLVIDFLHYNNISGRLDTDKQPRTPRIGDIAAYILLYTCLSRMKVSENKNDSLNKLVCKLKDLKEILDRDYWILLVDNSLSGTSLKSELEKICKLRDLINQDANIIVLVQIITSDALKVIECLIKQSNINLIKGIYLDNKFKINSEECELFNKHETREKVQELCKWFDKEILSNDKIYGKDGQWKDFRSENGFAYGFHDSGLTLVTLNCPSNSIPLLWYNNPDVYVGPYPRVESRMSQQKSPDSYLLDVLKCLYQDNTYKEGGNYGNTI